MHYLASLLVLCLYSTGRRRSKWDQPAPLPAGGGGVEEGQVVAEVAPPPVASQQETVNVGGGHGDESEGSKGGSQAEAARAAARLNAMLAAQGKLGSIEMVCEGVCVCVRWSGVWLLVRACVCGRWAGGTCVCAVEVEWGWGDCV